MDWTPIVVLLGLIVFAASIAWQFEGRHSILSTWAGENGYRLLDGERRRLMRGPFLLTTSKSQLVFRVSVETPSGEIRHGYLRCGSYFGGLFSNKAEVRWDAEMEHSTSCQTTRLH